MRNIIKGTRTRMSVCRHLGCKVTNIFWYRTI